MKAIWIRARSYATGETWYRYADGALTREEPPEPGGRVVDTLDHHVPSVALLRDGDGLAVAVAGYRTSQRRANSPRATASFLFAGAEQEARELAAALIADLGDPPGEGLGARLAAAVLDGVDTQTFRVDNDFPAILDEAARSAARRADLPASPPADDPLVATAPPVPENDRRAVVPEDEPWEGEEPAEGRPPSPVGGDLLGRPARPGRLVAGAMKLLALGGGSVTLVLYVTAARAAVDLADEGRAALGFDPPSDGVDWYQVVVLLLLFSIPLAACWALARLLRRRFDSRLRERFGDPGMARKWSRGRTWDRRAWMLELLRSPHWRPLAERWRSEGLLATDDGRLSDTRYREAAALVRAELDRRVGAVALGTGLAVGVAQRRTADALVVVGGSAELQIQVLADLGLRPNARTWLHIGGAAATGVLAATYVDLEERFEVQMLVRAAALGMDTAGGLLEDAGDELQEIVSEFLESAPTLGGLTATASGAMLGVTGGVVRQVGEFVAEIGDEVTEGVVVAAALHHHGMSLVADALALDDSHRAELAPTLGQVPNSLKDGAAAVARSRTAGLRRLLRGRIRAATRKAGGGLREKLFRRGAEFSAEERK